MTDDMSSDNIPMARTREEAIAQLRAQEPQSRWTVKTKDGAQTHIGVFIALPVLTAVCVAAVIVAVRVTGLLRAIALVVAALTGAWVTWVGLLITVFGRIVRTLRDGPDGPTE